MARLHVGAARGLAAPGAVAGAARPGPLDRWSADERRALVDLVRAKGGRSERDFVTRCALHPRLDAELRRGPARAIDGSA